MIFIFFLLHKHHNSNIIPLNTEKTHKTFSKFQELYFSNTFCKHINKLILCTTILHFNFLFLKHVANKVILQIKKFGPLMINRVPCKLNCNHIVTKHGGRMTLLLTNSFHIFMSHKAYALTKVFVINSTSI